MQTAALVISLLLSATAPAAEPPPRPIPAYSPEAQAVREGAALRRQGDALLAQGRGDDAREAWQGAAAAYRRAGYPPGETEVLVEGFKGPLVLLHREGRSTHLVVTFDVGQSNWPLRWSKHNVVRRLLVLMA